MKITTLLNYQIHQPENNSPAYSPIVLIHGLFGDLNNLRVLARDLRKDNTIIQVDVRNHGHSPHSESMHYSEMANDIFTLLDELKIPNVIVIGHSMGGKIAMTMTVLAPERIKRIVVIDMAPVAYTENHHDSVFAALEAVTQSDVSSRQEAANIMRSYIKEEDVIQFLLKSFKQGDWLFNLPAVKAAYPNIIGWQDIPTWPHPIIFIRGALSPYLIDQYRDNIAHQFPLATGFVVANTSHWVHSEKPDAVIKAIRRFLAIA